MRIGVHLLVIRPEMERGISEELCRVFSAGRPLGAGVQTLDIGQGVINSSWAT